METNYTLELLKHIHEYYPIGKPHFNNSYSGYQNLLKRLTNKINSLMNGGKIDEWDNLISSIKDKVPNRGMLDLSFHQFPNMLTTISIFEREENELVVKSEANLCISLLVDYYTIYFEKKVTLTRYKNKYDNPCQKKIIYGKTHLDKEEEYIYSTLKKITAEHFPSYNFISHEPLYNIKILGGLPHGEDMETIKEEYPIYRYLFGFTDDMRDTEVIH